MWKSYRRESKLIKKQLISWAVPPKTKHFPISWVCSFTPMDMSTHGNPSSSVKLV